MALHVSRSRRGNGSGSEDFSRLERILDMLRDDENVIMEFEFWTN